MMWLAGPYGFLLKLGMIVLGLGMLFLVGYKNGRDSMIPKLEAAKSDAQMWQKTADNRLRTIKEQNEAVDALKVSRETKVAELKNKLKKVIIDGQKAKKIADKKSEVILTMKLPENECSALTDLIDQARKD